MVADAVALVLVCRIAAGAMMSLRTEVLPEPALVWAWYGLAALYAAVAWMSGREGGRRRLATLLARCGGVAGALAAGAIAVSLPEFAPTAVSPVDWIALGCCLLLRGSAPKA